MALITPVLILGMSGLIEMGRLFHAWVTVQHAARSGTRAAITGRGSQDGTRLKLILKTTEKWTDNLHGSPATIVVRSWRGEFPIGPSRENDPGEPCDLIEIAVTYTYEPVIPFIRALFPNDGKLKLSTRDRKINEPWKPCR